MDGRLEISTLGGLSIRRDGEPVTGFVTRKVEALVVYLACTARSHPRDVLAELLWEERSQTQSLSNLRVALTNLRKCLAPFVRISRESVGLNPDADIWLDIHELEGRSLLTDGQDENDDIHPPESIRKLEQKVIYYQGDFLAGFSVRNCSGFDTWATFQRERIRSVFERKLSYLIDLLIADKNWLDVIKWSENWIAHGYHPELAYRSLMLAYCSKGDLASLSMVYQRCISAFRDELGIEPSEQTRKTYEALIRGEMRATLAFTPPGEPHATQASRAARMMLNQFYQDDQRMLDVASLAVIYTSRFDLDIDESDAEILIRSALHHGLEINPWLRRMDSPENAVKVLAASYEHDQNPKVRIRIVDALKGLKAPAAADLLLDISLKDESPEVRSAAAIAAHSQGRGSEVLSLLVNRLQKPADPTALNVFVAIVDEIGLPQGSQSYPKGTVALALARKRWRDNRGLVGNQILRGALGGSISVAFFGGLLPIFVSWGKPASYYENLQFISFVAWILSGVMVGFVLGGLQGTALIFATSLADTLFHGRSVKHWRFVFAGLAGFVYPAYLITFSLTGLLSPEVDRSIYIGMYLVYGLIMGLALSMVVPPLGSTFKVSERLARALPAIVIMVSIAWPVIFLVYPETSIYRFIEELCFIVILTIGMTVAVNTLSYDSTKEDQSDD